MCICNLSLEDEELNMAKGKYSCCALESLLGLFNYIHRMPSYQPKLNGV